MDNMVNVSGLIPNCTCYKNGGNIFCDKTCETMNNDKNKSAEETKRFAIYGSIDKGGYAYAEEFEDNEGEWVKFEDHQKAITTLQQANAELEKQNAELVAENKELTAMLVDVMRLRGEDHEMLRNILNAFIIIDVCIKHQDSLEIDGVIHKGAKRFIESIKSLIQSHESNKG